MRTLMIAGLAVGVLACGSSSSGGSSPTTGTGAAGTAAAGAGTTGKGGTGTAGTGTAGTTGKGGAGTGSTGTGGAGTSGTGGVGAAGTGTAGTGTAGAGTAGTGVAGKGGSGTAGAGGGAPTCGGSTCASNATCVKDNAGNSKCATLCKHNSDCGPDGPCCASLANGAAACLPNDFNGGNLQCQCFSGAECNSGACAPAVDAKMNPTPGFYVCKANDGAPYGGCNGAQSCAGSYCCVGDTNSNLFCASPCANDTMCGGAKCNGYDGSHTTCSGPTWCGPKLDTSMSARSSSAALIVLAVAGTACGTVNVMSRYNPEVPSKPAGCRLDVYKDAAKIPGPYERLCLIESKTGTTLFADKSVGGAIRQATPKACECGADALLVEDSTRKVPG